MIAEDMLKQIIINAKIAVTDEEMQTFQAKINEAIEMVSVISELDLTNVEPMFYPNEQTYTFRNPELELVTDREALLANTEEQEDGFFKVPAVLKEAE